MISIADQRDVPQYMDRPWLMTCVMALTISKTQNTHVQTKISAESGLLLYRSTVTRCVWSPLDGTVYVLSLRCVDIIKQLWACILLSHLKVWELRFALTI